MGTALLVIPLAAPPTANLLQMKTTTLVQKMIQRPESTFHPWPAPLQAAGPSNANRGDTGLTPLKTHKQIKKFSRKLIPGPLLLTSNSRSWKELFKRRITRTYFSARSLQSESTWRKPECRCEMQNIINVIFDYVRLSIGLVPESTGQVAEAGKTGRETTAAASPAPRSRKSRVHLASARNPLNSRQVEAPVQSQVGNWPDARVSQVA